MAFWDAGTVAVPEGRYRMGISDRRRALLRRVQEVGYIDASALALEFAVDGSTIRRDLAQLSRSGLIRRTHGGVLLTEPGAAIDVPYDMREHEHLAAKQDIARAAVALVKDGETLILDNGSTTYQIAAELRNRRNLTIVTNDLLIGLRIAGQKGHRLHMTGGVLLDTVYTLVGPAAVAALDGLHADWAFLGAEAIDAQAGVTNINVVEIPLKHAMMTAAAKTVFVADSTKFGKRAFATVCAIEAAHLIVTDRKLAPDLRTAFGARLRCV